MLGGALLPVQKLLQKAGEAGDCLVTSEGVERRFHGWTTRGAHQQLVVDALAFRLQVRNVFLQLRLERKHLLNRQSTAWSCEPALGAEPPARDTSSLAVRRLAASFTTPLARRSQSGFRSRSSSLVSIWPEPSPRVQA